MFNEHSEGIALFSLSKTFSDADTLLLWVDVQQIITYVISLIDSFYLYEYITDGSS